MHSLANVNNSDIHAFGNIESIYCDMTPERRNSPLLVNGLLKQVSVTSVTWQLKVGIVHCYTPVR
jgi:hypothetical protein